MKKQLLYFMSLVVVLAAAGFGAGYWMAGNSYTEVLETSEWMGSTEVWGEYDAYVGEECELVLIEGLEIDEQQNVVAGLYSEVPVSVATDLRVGIAELEALWVPPWGNDVDRARTAVVEWANQKVEVLQGQIETGSQVRFDRKDEWLDYLIEFGVFIEQRVPRDEAAKETAQHRLAEAARSEEQAEVAGAVFEDNDVKCDPYQDAHIRWP